MIVDEMPGDPGDELTEATEAAADAAEDAAEVAGETAAATVAVPIDIIRGLDERLSEYANTTRGLREAVDSMGVRQGSIEAMLAEIRAAANEVAEQVEETADTAVADAESAAETIGEAATPVEIQAPEAPARKKRRGLMRTKRRGR